MRGNSSSLVLGVAALVCFVVAVVLSVTSFFVAGDLEEKVSLKINHRSLMQEISNEKDELGGLLIRCDEVIRVEKAADLKKLMASHISAKESDDYRESVTELRDGWLLREAEISFPDVSLMTVAGFISSAESRPHPWRLASCDIKSTLEGRGRVVLRFFVLEKRKPREADVSAD